MHLVPGGSGTSPIGDDKTRKILAPGCVCAMFPTTLDRHLGSAGLAGELLVVEVRRHGATGIREREAIKTKYE